MSEHVNFLKKYYKAGNFLVSGRKIPRTGGIIVANANDKKELETIIKEDPFYKNKLAKFEIVEFNPSMFCDDLKQISEKLLKVQS